MTDKALTPNEQVKVVQEYRKNQLASDFPELKREDFASDKEFFEALREQTIAIQNREWEIVSMSVCTGAYNEFRGMSVTDAKSAVFSNANKTGGVQSYDQCTYDEYEDADAENQIADDVAGITSNNSGDMIVDASGRIDGFGYGKKTTWAHCAQTASLNIYTMAEALGLLSPSPTSDAEIASALGIHTGQSGGSALCGGDYSDKDVGHLKKVAGHQKKVADVGQLIKEGKIGPGTVISVCTDPTPSGTFSGYHALTIASVNRDENGNIVSYTVMDNNGGEARTRLQVVGIDEDHELNRWPTDEGNKPLHYTNTAAWANDQITQRYDTIYSPMFDDSGNLIGMNGKRFENEQEKIDAIRAMQRTNRLSVKAVSDEIDVLANRETTLLTDTNYSSKCGGNYRAQLLKEQQERLGQYYSTQVDMIGVAGIENDILAQQDANDDLRAEISSREVGITAINDRKITCCENFDELTIREGVLAESCSAVKAQAQEGSRERSRRFNRRMSEYQNITNAYDNLSEDYGNDLTAINEDFATEQTNYSTGIDSVNSSNEAISLLDEENARLIKERDDLSGCTEKAISDREENANNRFNNQQEIGTILQNKGSAIDSIEGSVSNMEELSDNKEANLSAQESVVANYQMVVDYATLSRREIREKYGCSYREFKDQLEAINNGVLNEGVEITPDVEVETPVVGVPVVTTQFTEEAREDVGDVMDEQHVDAEEQYQQNASEIASGVYGNDVENPIERADVQVVEVDAPVVSVEREKTKSEIQKETKMNGWFSHVGIDTAMVNKLVEKYGIDVAYDLALTSMTNPAKVCKGTDGKWRNSKACLNYFLENEVADEVVANITGRRADDVAKARPYRKVEGIKVETEKPLFNNEIKLHLSPLADTVER